MHVLRRLRGQPCDWAEEQVRNGRRGTSWEVPAEVKVKGGGGSAQGSGGGGGRKRADWRSILEIV